MSAVADWHRTPLRYIGLTVRIGTALACSVFAGVAGASEADLLGRPAALEGFVDGIMAAESVDGMVGASVAIVAGDRTLLVKGYGLADIDTGRPSNGELTLFRLGSVSKVLIWIGVAQQYQAGSLMLDDEVNQHLTDLQIPDTYPVPITLEHLLTQSAGFEDRILGLFARGRRTAGTFHERLVEMLPARVELPGRKAVYSNYGTALAARLVEQSAGMDWNDYVEKHIFGPLGMTRSTTRQPPPKPLDDAVAQGYRLVGDTASRVPFEFVTLSPVGSASSTARDMSRLLKELLQTEDSAVLRGMGRRLLMHPGLANDVRLNRMLMGLYERNSHGQRIVGQHGVMGSFRSELLLYPELGLGVFVSFNTDDSEAPARFAEAFNDRLFGRPVAAGEPRAERALVFSGYYASMRRPHTTPAKLGGQLGMIRAFAGPDGFLRLSGASASADRARLIETEPGVFDALAGSTRVAFTDTAGGGMQMSLNSRPYVAYERASGLQHPAVIAGVPLLCALMFAGVLVWPLGMSQHQGRARVSGERSASLIALIVVGLLVAFLVALGSALRDPFELTFGLPQRLTDAMWLPVVAAPLVLIQLMLVMRAWARSFWWPARRIHYTLLTVAAGVLIGWCAYFNLLALMPPFMVG